jgi:hypothetical protein
MVLKVLGTKLAENLHKEIKVLTLDLNAKIMSLQKNNIFIEKHTAAIASLVSGNLPKDARSVAIALECKELDSCFTTEQFTVGTGIFNGGSIRDAKEFAHLNHLHIMAELDLELCQSRRMSLRVYTKRSAF